MGLVVAGTDPLRTLEQLAHRTGEAAIGDDRRHDRGTDDGDRDRRPATIAVAASIAGEDAVENPERDPHEGDGDGEAEEAPTPPHRSGRAPAVCGRWAVVHRSATR